MIWEDIQQSDIILDNQALRYMPGGSVADRQYMIFGAGF